MSRRTNQRDTPVRTASALPRSWGTSARADGTRPHDPAPGHGSRPRTRADTTRTAVGPVTRGGGGERKRWVGEGEPNTSSSSEMTTENKVNICLFTRYQN